MDNVVRIEDFELSKVSLSEININKYGGKSVYINYDGRKTPLYLSLPSMMLPFGINKWVDENNKDGPAKYSFTLSFNGMDNDPKLKTCYEKLTALDELMVNKGVENSKKWFKKKKGKAVIEDNYNSIIKQDDEKKYAPKFNKINVGVRQVDNEKGEKEDVLTCTFYDSGRNEIQVRPEQIVKRTRFKRFLVKCKGLYLLGSKFGLTWLLEQAKPVFPAQLNKYALGDDDDDDVVQDTEIAVDNQVEDTDSSDDETEDSD